MTHGGYQPNMLLGCTFVYFGAVRADGSEFLSLQSSDSCPDGAIPTTNSKFCQRHVFFQTVPRKSALKSLEIIRNHPKIIQNHPKTIQKSSGMILFCSSPVSLKVWTRFRGQEVGWDSTRVAPRYWGRSS